ncbi:hypothetical protein [Nannocystis pusilla]|uniref:hypothetical protein n=1 Tax=Nannocystis pusilla TaxID=889268 RepID=UPI003B7FF934
MMTLSLSGVKSTGGSTPSRKLVGRLAGASPRWTSMSSSWRGTAKPDDSVCSRAQRMRARAQSAGTRRSLPRSQSRIIRERWPSVCTYVAKSTIWSRPLIAATHR